MKRLFEIGNQYVEESTWKDLALIKFCLCAMGIVIGAQIPQKHRKIVTGIAAGVFMVIYIPLMKKLFNIIFTKNDK